MATGGLDAIPAVVELFGDVGKDAGLPPTDLDPVFFFRLQICLT